jgi:hypothetical protein
MRTVRPGVRAERAVPPAEFERMLRRAERLQRQGGPRLIAMPHRGQKRDASAA